MSAQSELTKSLKRTGEVPSTSEGIIHLRNLLADPGLSYKPVYGGIDKIQEEFKAALGARLPDELVEQLKMGQLEYKLLTTTSSGLVLPLFFIGVPDENGVLSDALATIELQRIISNLDGGIVNYSLRVSGLSLSSEGRPRAVGIDYSLFDECNAYRFDFSVSGSETSRIPQLAENEYKEKLNRILMPIPTMSDTPYYTSGFITETMTNLCGHNRVLSIYDSTHIGKKLGFLDYGVLTTPWGFTTTSTTEEHRINHRDWSLAVPKKLA